MTYKVGDRVEWTDPIKGPPVGSTGTIVYVGTLCTIKWDVAYMATRGELIGQNSWQPKRFRPLTLLSPFEARVQDYIRSELQGSAR